MQEEPENSKRGLHSAQYLTQTYILLLANC